MSFLKRICPKEKDVSDMVGSEKEVCSEKGLFDPDPTIHLSFDVCSLSYRQGDHHAEQDRGVRAVEGHWE